MLRHITRAGCTTRWITRRISTGPVGLLDDLSHRGFVQDVTTPQHLHEALENGQQTVYAGIDPSAAALHVGHLLPLMGLLHFHVRGHTIIPLIGGATGLIGDPSGRATEREPAETETTERNTAALARAVELFFKRAVDYADDRLVLPKAAALAVQAKNNIDWHRDMTMMDFLRNVGVHSRVNTMLNKESVKTRLDSKAGISFTEFTYQLLQAYDFHYLHKHFGCSIQLGGSDQWGNILAGISLINRMGNRSPTAVPTAFGLTTPLLTSSAGVKFGKTAGNAVWLDPQLTSIFNFYQYFVKAADHEVESLLKLFTLMSWSEIHETMESHRAHPHKRIAQKRLAAEVTELIHTKSGLATAETVTKIMYGVDLAHVKAADIADAFRGDPCLHTIDRDELTTTPVMRLAVKYGLLVPAACRMLILSRGLYYNNNPVLEPQFTLRAYHLVDNQVAILRAGKDKIAVLATAT
ncbi:hypothetical protein C8J57DRAFT_1048705 [Mycena rebaudengoi]|nr:hypothetical protein C8J57DRAFT_1048705 [Mycena rebaudengoi]